LTEEQYKFLCSTCDSILLEDNAQFERIAIPWLHVIREHPVFLQQYEDLFCSQRLSKHLESYAHNILIKAYSSFRLMWRIIRWPRKNWVIDPQLTQSYDVVFISHLLSTSQLSTDNDFYFGNVPNLLAQQGFSVLVALINHTSVSDSILTKHIKSSHIQRLIIPKSLPLASEYKIWKKTLKQASLLRKKAKVENDQFKKSVLKQSAREATSNSTKTSIRISKVIGEVVSQASPRVIVSTYEGHSWERLAFSSARKASLNSNIKCVAYQHAALFRLQHASRRLLGKKYDPDVILTSGKVGFKKLREAENLRSVPLAILGSNRSIKYFQRKSTDTCIVLPEGILTECEILFSFSLACARKYRHINFIWRLHPIISFEDIARVGIETKSLPNNVMISRKTLEEDLTGCRWALYRGSTAIVAAAAHGIIPIYLNRAEELSIDPLYEIAADHPSISSIDQFLSVLDWSNWGDHSKNYCREFYAPFNIRSLNQILKNDI
jgi:hypothetical protein